MMIFRYVVHKLLHAVILSIFSKLPSSVNAPVLTLWSDVPSCAVYR